MNWRLVDSGVNDAFFNMAVDEALLGSSVPVLRFYQWKPAAVSLGYFQKADSVDMGVCKDLGIDVVRRTTGGKAVLHDIELTYSFIIDEDKMPAGVVESYKLISKGIVSALRSIGLDAAMRDVEPEKNGSAVCFSEPSWYEIVVNGKKIVGSAQKRLNGKLLQHGSVLIDVDFGKLSRVFGADVGVLREKITSLKDEGCDVLFSELASSIKDGFEQNFNVKLENSYLTVDELKKTSELVEKYSSDEWNSGKQT